MGGNTRENTEISPVVEGVQYSGVFKTRNGEMTK